MFTLSNAVQHAIINISAHWLLNSVHSQSMASLDVKCGRELNMREMCFKNLYVKCVHEM